MIKNKKVLVVVPARGGSKGIRLKNLRKINGKSLIEITSNFIKKLKFVDYKIVSTDNLKIIKEAEKHKFNIIERPKKLSGDRISDYQVLEHCINKLYRDGMIFDIVIYLQPTSPFRKINHLYKSLQKMIKSNYSAIWSVTKVNKKFHPLKVLRSNKNNLELYLNKGKKIIARQQLENIYIRNGIFYIFNIKDLLKNKSIYLKKTLLSITEYQHVNIDNLSDLKKAQSLIN